MVVPTKIVTRRGLDLWVSMGDGHGHALVIDLWRQRRNPSRNVFEKEGDVLPI